MYVHTCNIEQFGHETSNESLFITRRWSGVYASIFHREKFTDPRGEAGVKGAKVRYTLLWMQVRRSTMLRPNICYYALGLEWQRFQEFGEAARTQIE